MKQLLKKLLGRGDTPKPEQTRHALVGSAKLWKMKRDFQIKFLLDMGLKPENYLFEIGCGTLRGGIPIIEHLERGHYFGVEVREEVLEEGRIELSEAGLEGKEPTLIHSLSMAELNLDQRFDYIWAFSVLIHMTDEILSDTLGFASRHLAEQGVFYANVNMCEREEDNWQGFPVVGRSFDFYSDACSKHGLALSEIGTLKALGHLSQVEAQDQQRMLKITKSV